MNYLPEAQRPGGLPTRIPDNAKSNFRVNAVHKVTIRKASGESLIREKSMDFQQGAFVQGAGHFPASHSCGRPEDNIRQDSRSLLIQDKTIIDDGQGNIFTDEKAIRFENTSESQGTLMISNRTGPLNMLGGSSAKLLDHSIGNILS